MIRKILSFYRRFLYIVFRRKRKGLITNLTRCEIVGDIEDFKKDCVHPCVRYTSTSFLGYHWWMVYTPYHNANAMQENPILCYGEGKDVPPIRWHVYKEIVSQPPYGYNSDPNLLFRDGKLFVFWRENETPRVKLYGLIRATFCVTLSEDGLFSYEHPVLKEASKYEDHEVSPTFLTYMDKDLALSNHVLFKLSWVDNLHPFFKFFFDKFFLVTDLLGLFAQQKSYGIAIWRGDGLQNSYTYEKTISPEKCNYLYRLWHSDAFEYKGRLYMILQSNQCNADICLAMWNNDMTKLRLYPLPLITSYSIKKVGIYKPTALVYNDTLYIYISAQDVGNRASNLLYQCRIPFIDIANTI